MAQSLPYHEPGIITILVLSSFLLALNALNWALDRLVYCGLVGQLLIGVAWGTPGAQWLSASVEQAIVQLGYLGLILIVYEGGLSTDLRTLRANLLLSATVALTGIVFPIGLSFILQSMLAATPLQAFAAGAALCSTSLGTTFTVLTTSRLTESRLGVILSSAAMMDDVVGLVMVKVISNLGPDSSFDATTVVRPVLVSVAFAVLVPVLCRWVVRPLTLRMLGPLTVSGTSGKASLLNSQSTMLLIHTAVLLALVTGSTYAGTSGLFAAYLAGASITWWSHLLMEDANKRARPPPQPEKVTSGENEKRRQESTQASPDIDGSAPTHSVPAITVSNNPTEVLTQGEAPALPDLSGLAVYERFYAPAVQSMLKPFFFASIGFSIPIAQLFRGAVVWRGIVYATLMTFGKLMCGAWLLRFAGPVIHIPNLKRVLSSLKQGCWPPLWTKKERPPTSSSELDANPQSTPRRPAVTEAKASKSRKPSKPLSLYPAAILGSAMVARGEIGFLISAVAESKGIFHTSGGSSDLFFVVTWAILLCTIVGPITVGLLVRRVKRLQESERTQQTGRADPLGVWGVIPSRDVGGRVPTGGESE